MRDIVDGWSWIVDSANWWGRNGIVRAIGDHVRYSAIALAVAAAVGIPLGLLIGHTRRGQFVAVNAAGLWRAIPTVGVVALVFRWRPLSVWPVIAALVILAVPPVLLNTMAGIEAVGEDVRDAARGMGLTGWQVLWQVEVPNALPMILAGVRSAANQVIATATVAGFVGLHTLGRFIFSALGTQRYYVMAGASMLVIALVLAVEGVFALAQRAAVSPGVRPPRRRFRRAGAVPLVEAAALAAADGLGKRVGERPADGG